MEIQTKNREPQTKVRPHRRRPAIALSLLFVAAFFAGCASEEFRMLTTVEERYPPASKCGKCHIEIYEEWKQSVHSRSYSNDAFRHATNEYSFQDCLGCHSPISIHSSGVPATRNIARDEGVTCASCHINQGTLTGPIDPTAAIVPHAVGVEKGFFKASALCGACHQGTFDEWRQAKMDNKKNCQDCHMPEVKRKVTQATDIMSKILVGTEEEHNLKRHTFDYRRNNKPEEIVSFNVRWQCAKDVCSVDVVVVNKLPHLIPTGDFGFRKGALALTAKSDDGTIVARKSVDLYKEIKTALSPMEQNIFRFSLPDETSQIELKLLREGQYESNRFIIAERTFFRRGTGG